MAKVLETTKSPDTIINLKAWHIFVHFVGLAFLTGGAYYQANDAYNRTASNENKIQSLQLTVNSNSIHFTSISKDLDEIKGILRRTAPYERK